MLKSSLNAFIAAASIITVASTAHAQEPFFAGKSISLLIGTTPGGGYDVYARALARHMGRHLPGQSRRSLPRTCRAPADSRWPTTLQSRRRPTAPRSPPCRTACRSRSCSRRCRPAAATRCSTRRSSAGSAASTQTVFVTVTWHTSPVKTLKDATEQAGHARRQRDQLRQLRTGVLEQPPARHEIQDRRTAIDGAAEVDLAVENGEVDGDAGKDWTTLTATRPTWIEDKKINILVQMGMKPHRRPQGRADGDRPRTQRRGPRDHGAGVRQVRHGAAVPRPARFVPDRLELLRRAFDATMQDRIPCRGRESSAWRSTQCAARTSRRWSPASCRHRRQWRRRRGRY